MKRPIILSLLCVCVSMLLAVVATAPTVARPNITPSEIAGDGISTDTTEYPAIKYTPTTNVITFIVPE